MNLEQALDEVLGYIDDNIENHKNTLESTQKFRKELNWEKKLDSISKTSFFGQFRIKRLNKRIRDIESSIKIAVGGIDYWENAKDKVKRKNLVYTLELIDGPIMSQLNTLVYGSPSHYAPDWAVDYLNAIQKARIVINSNL